MIESTHAFLFTFHIHSKKKMMKDTVIDWLGTFWKVLVSPTPEMFLQEAKKANGKFASAVGWLVFYAIYVYVLASIAINRAPLSVPTLLAAILVIPLSVLLFTSAIHFISQRMFRHKEYLYDKILYMTVSVLFPIFFIFTLLSLFLPENIFRFVSFILLLYPVALLTIGLKSIADIEYWQALLNIFLSILVAILVGGITAITIYATVAGPGGIRK